LATAGLNEKEDGAALFCTALGRTRTLPGRSMTANDMGRMAKRRLGDIGASDHRRNG